MPHGISSDASTVPGYFSHGRPRDGEQSTHKPTSFADALMAEMFGVSDIDRLKMGLLDPDMADIDMVRL
jgi:hypothetical protein